MKKSYKNVNLGHKKWQTSVKRTQTSEEKVRKIHKLVKKKSHKNWQTNEKKSQTSEKESQKVTKSHKLVKKLQTSEKILQKCKFKL